VVNQTSDERMSVLLVLSGAEGRSPRRGTFLGILASSVLSVNSMPSALKSTSSIFTQLDEKRRPRPIGGFTFDFQLSTVDLPPPTFLLPAAATVVGFTTGNVEARSEPNRSPRASSFFIRLGRPPQHAHRPHRSSRRARTNQNRPLLPGKNIHGQLQSSRLPLSIAP